MEHVDDVPVAPHARPATRRAFLGGSVLAGLVALTPGLGSSGASAATRKTTKKTVKKATTTTKKATATTATTVAAAKASGGTFAAAQEMAITFTYTPTAQGGRIQNPYIAVFVEDADGNLLRTIDLSVQTSGRGARYISDLRHWFTAEQAAVAKGYPDILATLSSATKLPGTYNVVWDGKDDKGALVPTGSYLLGIEAAREHGPYQLVREPISISGKTFTTKVADNGELTAITLELRAR